MQQIPLAAMDLKPYHIYLRYMKNILFILIGFLTACKSSDITSIQYDKNLFQCQWQPAACNDPLVFPVFLVDSLQSEKKIPIYEHCKEDSLLVNMLSNVSGKIPYYLGTLKDTSIFQMSSILIENTSGANVNRRNGFVLIRSKKPNKQGYYLLKTFSSGSDQQKRIETRYKDGYFYIQCIDNPNYDVRNAGNGKKIITYCIVSVFQAGDPILLNRAQGEKIYKELFQFFSH